MAKLLKLRRGTTSQHGSFTGAEGEVTVDTDKETLVVHDGSTAGGHAVAAEDMANVSSASIVGRLGSGSIVKAKLEADIIDGTKLADDAVNSEHYVDASIDHQHLSNDCIDGDNIQDDVINSEHIAAGAVDLEHMSSESVDEDNLKISNSGSNGQYLSKQSGNAGGLTWATVDFSPYAPLASPALTGTATGVNLTLSGNLTVNGTTTTVATTNTTVTDNLIELNSGVGSNGNDCGILIERGSTGNNAIFAWDEANDRFSLGTTTATNTATGTISINTGSLAANLVGNVTGNCTGSSGSCTGNAASATNADTVDSLHASSFVRSDTADTASGDITFSGGAGAVSIAGGSDIRFATGSWTGEHAGKIQLNSDWLYIQAGSSGINFRSSGGTDRWKINSSGNLHPNGNNAYDIGASSNYINMGYIKDVYCSNWLRLSGTDTGLYHSGNVNYIYSDDANYWTIAYNGSSGGLRIRDGHNGTVRGYLYATDSNEVGFLDHSGSWALNSNRSTNYCYLYDQHFVSDTNNGYDLGTSSVRWRNIYANTSVFDGKGNLRDIPSSSKTSAYTLVASDAGKCIITSSGTVTVPNNVMSTSNAVSIINNSGSDITIAQASGLSLYNTGDASTGNKTLAGRGMATIWFASNSAAYISGSGLS